MRRVGTEWLARDGCALIDVFSPWNWARQHGETSEYCARDGTPWQRTVEFDAVASRIRDSWSPVGGADERRTQLIRCYSMPEFRLLVEGTGLLVRAFHGMDGRLLDDADDHDAETNQYVTGTNGFFAVLERDPESMATTMDR